MSTLGPREIGHRVVVRHRLAGNRLTDLLGVLQSVDADTLTVRRMDATVNVVARADVTAAKTIPPMLLRPVDRERLPLVTALGRPAVETVRLGDWLLRASGGWTGRGNSLLPHGSPGLELDEALQRVHAFYRERELPPLALTVIGSPLEQQLRSRGWVDSRPYAADTLVLHTTLDLVNAEPAWPVTVTAHPDQDWYGVQDGLPPVARQVLEGAPVSGFATIRVDGQVVAAGRAALTGHWVGIDTVRVLDDQQRRGLGTAVVRGLARWGGGAGGRRTYLEVEESNTAALTAYQNLGYVEAYRYRYRYLTV